MDTDYAKKTWDDFRGAGLLWFVNSLLHIFGWAIVIMKHDDGTMEAYPARTRLRGFGDVSDAENRKKLSRFMRDNAIELDTEVDWDA